MTTWDDSPPNGDRQAEALGQFLDRRAAGDPAPRTGLDPDLARTVDRLQNLADATVAAHVSGADEAHAWETLMQNAARPRLVALPPAAAPATAPIAHGAGARWTGPDQAGWPVPASSRLVAIRPGGTPSRLQRLGHQSLGLVATLTLVALVGLSGLAVYLSAPQRDDGATVPIIAGASPTSEPVPADLRDVIPSTCVQEPRDYVELMRMIRAPLNNGEVHRIFNLRPQATAIANATNPELEAFQLPDGPEPDEATSRAVVSTLSQFHGCQTVYGWHLQAASLTTDDYWYRTVYHSDRGGAELVLLWSDDQYLATAPPEERTASPPAENATVRDLGSDPLYELYGFRLIDEDRVGAYLSPGSRLTGVGDASVLAVQPEYDQRGYVVFAQGDDGRWLIDEIVSPPFTPAEDCDQVCATPAAP
ncbi:MAG: hypothetical protein AVDCRST_MAG33-2678 [uncultured Thermomicrobiales bacterium]|uniref:Uncharacterized protein n=1 Tax=uncultured Thermomicrobiales bacterium TaxID=1645740 RepID=A0A6J4V9D3_9BACT|nr:MAG: hypothetical protein AVDCRST_MAG33-2678 [uncultured Thermomicrobiales bacterium]